MSFESVSVLIGCDGCINAEEFEAHVVAGLIDLHEAFERDGWYEREDQHFCPACAGAAKAEDRKEEAG